MECMDELPEAIRVSLDAAVKSFLEAGWRIHVGRPDVTTYSTPRVAVQATPPGKPTQHRNFDESPSLSTEVESWLSSLK
jgi:hypothetical protein